MADPAPPSTPPSVIDRAGRWMRGSVTLRLMVVAILMLLLLIPADMVSDLVRERSGRRDEAVAAIGAFWGRPQTLVGPVLTVPYTVVERLANGQQTQRTEHAYFLPEELTVTGRIKPEVRYRGIYEAVVYRSNLRLSGTFRTPGMAPWGISPERVRWPEAALVLGLADVRGIRDKLVLNWDSTAIGFEPGIVAPGLGGPTRTPSHHGYSGGRSATVEMTIDDQTFNRGGTAGVSAAIPVADEAGLTTTHRFSLDLSLDGSEGMWFTPVGRTTTAQLTSNWASPSFNGAFLPERRTVADSGFSAGWRVLHLNRSFPQAWRSGTEVNLTDAAFGASLLVPVDTYTKTSRAAKYAILLISLTFLTFFFTEIGSRRRVHPFQYLLVGLALCLFYALLLALAEQLPFAAAYGLASVVVIGMVGLYTWAVLGSVRSALLVALLLGFLNGFVLVLLQLEDHALLVGTLGLTVILGLVMYLSRRVDWYRVTAPPADESR